MIFAMRQRTLNDLRTGNDALHKELEIPVAPVEPGPIPKERPAVPTNELTADERIELLRLRGQMRPLLDELQAASNRVAEFARAKAEQRGPVTVSQPRINGDQPHMQVMEAYRRTPAFKDAEAFGSALRNYLSRNGGQLPEDLARVESYGDGGLPAGVSRRFEQMLSGPIPEDARSRTLFAREKDPQQQADGWFTRIYFFADGTRSTFGMNSASYTQDWTVIERRAEAGARQRALQRAAQ